MGDLVKESGEAGLKKAFVSWGYDNVKVWDCCLVWRRELYTPKNMTAEEWSARNRDKERTGCTTTTEEHACKTY